MRTAPAAIAQPSPPTSARRPRKCNAAVGLLDEGATVPFIARYRKEVTGGLDDTQLRTLEERLVYLRELEDRRAAILASIDEQGKLTMPAREIEAADTKRGWKTSTCRTSRSAAPRRRSRAKPGSSRWPMRCWPIRSAIRSRRPPRPLHRCRQGRRRRQGRARRRARHPDRALERRCGPARRAARLAGDRALIRAKVVEGKQTEGAKYRDYFDHAEPIKIPSHRLLALLRGRNEASCDLDLMPRVQRHRAENNEDGGHEMRRPAPARRRPACRHRRHAAGADTWLLESPAA
jgi:uncharacterized protein